MMTAKMTSKTFLPTWLFYWIYHVSFLLIIFIFYRVLLLQEIQASYQIFTFWGKAEYAVWTLPHSALVILGLALTFALIQTLVNVGKRDHSLTRWVVHSIIALVYLGLAFLLGFLVNFFQIYERMFHKSMLVQIGQDSFVELIHSALAEISPTTFKIVGVVVIFILSYIVWRLFRLMFVQAAFYVQSLLRFLAYALLVLCIMGALSIAVWPEWYLTDQSQKYLSHLRQNPEQQPRIFPLRELRANPIHLALKQPKRSVASAVQLGFNHNLALAGDKTISFSRKSLASARLHPRVTAIPRGRKYNIVLYFFESTSASYVGKKINGRSVTPVWDRLRQNSFVAHNHYANYPLSVNAIYTTLSSAYALPAQSWITQEFPNAKITTLPQKLKEHGYRTAMLHSASLGYAWQRPFYRDRFEKIIEFRDLAHTHFERDKISIDDRALLQPALRFAQKSKDQPFFMVVMPFYPHHPYKIPHKRFDVVQKNLDRFPWKKRKWYKYLNSLHFSDYVLGQLIDKLKKNNLMHNTLIFVVSDHGEAFYQHRGNYNHPHYIYEENVHVPFVIYSPRFFAEPHSHKGLTSHLDIAPTIYDILGIHPPSTVDGGSILSAHQERMVLLHTFWNEDYIGVRDGPWKYIRRIRDGREQLYNLNQDPQEKQNLIHSKPEIAKRYREAALRGRSHKRNYYKEITGRYPPYPKSEHIIHPKDVSVEEVVEEVEEKKEDKKNIEEKDIEKDNGRGRKEEADNSNNGTDKPAPRR